MQAHFEEFLEDPYAAAGVSPPSFTEGLGRAFDAFGGMASRRKPVRLNGWEADAAAFSHDLVRVGESFGITIADE